MKQVRKVEGGNSPPAAAGIPLAEEGIPLAEGGIPPVEGVLRADVEGNTLRGHLLPSKQWEGLAGEWSIVPSHTPALTWRLWRLS